MSDDSKQIEEVNVARHMAKRTAKNSVFLDLFQNKSYLLKLYKTLHPEDTTATQHKMTQKAVTETIRICKDRNVLREYLAEREKEVRAA